MAKDVPRAFPGNTLHFRDCISSPRLNLQRILKIAKKGCRVVYIPGQEERNVEHLLEHGAAVFARNPQQLVFKAGRLLREPERLDAMRRSARSIARPDAAQAIVSCLAAQGAPEHSRSPEGLKVQILDGVSCLRESNP